MRIVHLIEQAAPQATPTTFRLMAAAIAAAPQHQHEVILLGGKPMRDMAKAAGLRDFHLISVPAGRVDLTAMRKAIRIISAVDGTISHLWSPSVFRGSKGDVATILDGATSDPETAGQLLVLTADADRENHLVKGHAWDYEIAYAPVPARMPIAPPHAPVEILHERWGEPTDVDNVILLTESLPGPDAYKAALAVILAEDSDAARPPRLRLLIHPDQTNRERACETVNNLDAPHRVVDEPYVLAPWVIAHGCRFAMIASDTPLPLVAWAMAAGLVIVGEQNDAASSILVDGETALLSSTGEPKHLAHRLRTLIDDRALADRLSSNAKTLIDQELSFERFSEALRHVYLRAESGSAAAAPSSV